MMIYRPEIKAKKVSYGGNDFRSTIEARWAVFFDSLAITYEYEKEYAQVEAGCRIVWYKPDFQLPELHKYIEIKAKKPQNRELTKAAGWSEDIGDIVVLFDLNPPKENTESGWLFSWTEYNQKATLFKNMWWCECPRCGAIDICKLGEVECGCFSQKELNKIYEQEDEQGFRCYFKFEHSPRLLAAYKRAKNYKFKNQRRVLPIPAATTIWQFTDNKAGNGGRP